MKNLSNEEWVELIKNEDSDAYIYLTKFLTKALNYYLSNDFHLQDIVQDTLIKIHTKIHTFRGTCKFTTWANKIAINRANDYISRMPDNNLLPLFEDILLSETLSQSDIIQGKELEIFINKSIDNLNNQFQRDVLQLTIREYTTKEIAYKLNTTENCIYKTRCIARKPIKKQLAEYYGETIMSKFVFAKNGPILFFEEGEEKPIAFCRCRATLNFPYCDGSHQVEENLKLPKGEIAIESKQVCCCG